MKTLHQQQDSHHQSDVRTKNMLASNKNETTLEHPNSNMSSLFAPLNHFGMDDHSLIPFYRTEKHLQKKEGRVASKPNEVTKSVIEAYNKQITISLDATQKFHKEFIDQITNIYNLNQQFWRTFLFSKK